MHNGQMELEVVSPLNPRLWQVRGGGDGAEVETRREIIAQGMYRVGLHHDEDRGSCCVRVSDGVLQEYFKYGIFLRYVLPLVTSLGKEEDRESLETRLDLLSTFGYE